MVARLATPILAGVVLVAGCQQQHEAHEAHEPRWSYSGDTGPEHWGELNPYWAIAATGHRQSPIDIRPDEALPGAFVSLDFEYEPTHVELVNNGHTIELEYDDGSAVEVDGVRYKLVQLHFHSPSEHTINGRQFALEMHLVHRDERGDLTVVALLVEEGERNDAVARIWDRLPEQPGQRLSLPDAFVNVNRLLPKTRRYYLYEGSLTTPPCTEGVTWLVLQDPIGMSPDQIDQFRSLYPHSNRPVQPLHDREVFVEE